MALLQYKTSFETEKHYHVETRQVNSVNAVCRSDVSMLGKSFACIVHTGASDTVLSHSVVRCLGLMDRLMPSHTSFLAPAGPMEKPMGLLLGPPISPWAACACT